MANWKCRVCGSESGYTQDLDESFSCDECSVVFNDPGMFSIAEPEEEEKPYPVVPRDEGVEKIREATGCCYQTAKKAWKRHDGDVEGAVRTTNHYQNAYRASKGLEPRILPPEFRQEET